MAKDPSQVEEIDEDALVGKVAEFYALADEGHADWRERAYVARDFNAGHQWSDADLATLREGHKPALTINRIKPTMRFIGGCQRQNRKDIRVLPLRNASESAASVLTDLVKHAMDCCHAEFVMAECFRTGGVSGKGWLFVEIVNDELDTSSRYVQVNSLDPFRVFEDPAANEYDLNKSAKFIIREYFEDAESCRQRWPDKADLLGSTGASNSGIADRIGKMVESLLHKTGAESDVQAISGDEQRAGTADRFRLCVRECWWRNYRTVGVVTDSSTGETEMLVQDAEQAAGKRLAAENPEKYSFRQMPKAILNKTVVVGTTLVEHTVDPLGGIHDYPFFRYVPDFTDGHARGEVEDLISPQEEENKRRSQALHHLNQSSNSGWIVKTVSALYRTFLETFGSKPGMVIETDKCGGHAERITPAPISEGHLQLAMSAAQDIKEISGVANLVGYDSQQKESGIALGVRQRQGMTILEEVFDRFDYTAQLMGSFLVELIRRDLAGKPIYSDQEIAAICDLDKAVDGDLMKQVMPVAMEQVASQAAPPPPEAMADPNAMAAHQQAMVQAAEPAARQAAVAILMHQVRDVITGRYSVKVAQSPNAPTARAAAFEELTEVGKMFPGAIPPETFVEATDIRNKDQIVQAIEQYRQEQAQAAAGAVAQGPGAAQ